MLMAATNPASFAFRVTIISTLDWKSIYIFIFVNDLKFDLEDLGLE